MLNRLGLTPWLAVAMLCPAPPAVAASFQGTLTIDILDNLFEIPAAGAGDAALDATTGAFDLPAGAFGVTDFGGDFPPDTPRDIIPPLVAGALTTYTTTAGSFAPRPGGIVGGAMSIVGSFDFVDDMDDLLLGIVLDPIGAGGTAPAIVPPPLDQILSALTSGTEWSTGTVTANDVIVDGVPGQSISRSGFDNRDANGLGMIRLVAASEMTIDGGEAFFVRVPTFATLDVVVPEPGAVLMLGAGSLVLAAAAGRRG